jgi:hypothetical protein
MDARGFRTQKRRRSAGKIRKDDKMAVDPESDSESVGDLAAASGLGMCRVTPQFFF